MTQLPERLLQIYDILDQHYQELRYQPTQQEIADQLGISKATVSEALLDMEAWGMIERTGRQRGIKLLSRNPLDEWK